MKKTTLFTLLTFYFSFAILSPNFVQAKANVHLWHDIIFLDAGNYQEFTHQMSKTRDATRKMLWAELGEYLMPAIQAGGDAGSTALALAEVLIRFDRLHDEHVTKAKSGIAVSLNSLLLGHFGDLYNQLGLSDNEKHAEFQNFQEIKNSLKLYHKGKLTKAQKKELLSKLEGETYYVLYGSYTVRGGGGVTLSLIAENLLSGEIRSMTASGTIGVAVEQLAAKLFDLLQTNKYPDLKDPQPNLEWIVPRLLQHATAQEARAACEGQNARLPYAQELVLATQMTNYRKGGLPPINPKEIYLVADMHRDVSDLYYFGYEQMKGDPRGHVHDKAGYGRIYPAFYCVKGDASLKVRLERDIYRAYRAVKENDDEIYSESDIDEILLALEFILNRSDCYGKRTYYKNRNQELIDIKSAFRSTKKAIQTLEKHNLIIDPQFRPRLMLD